MGGIRRHKNRHKKPQGKRDEWGPPRGGGEGGRPRGAGYKDIVRENARFEEFYRRQGVCADESELQEMMAALRRDLPASFRVTGTKSQALAIRNIIESKYFKDLADASLKQEQEQRDGNEESRPVEPKCLEWYPDRMAWQLNLTRRDIRRVEAYFRLHNFLVSETESGNISRQETVSMIPPLVLDVRPDHRVLDMCAAPGSKTAQLIEAIHKNDEQMSKGLVVANDSDNARCYMLVHQARRLQSPNFIITNADASIMPKINVKDERTGEMKQLKFDRVLADVPCSGDGTLRKNADIWPKWNAANSCNLHGIQYRIAKRGLELLEVGGRLVYSTCSLNPLEDEAVVHRLLRESGGAVELVDATALVPGLLHKPGLSKWAVASRDNAFFESFDQVPETLHSLIRPAMFPPAADEADKYRLDRCLRILPHQQDTGGFFVAALAKRSPCAWESGAKKAEAKAEEGQKAKADPTSNGGAKRKSEDDESEEAKPSKLPRRERSKNPNQRLRGFNEDPFVYLDEKQDDAAFVEIR